MKEKGLQLPKAEQFILQQQLIKFSERAGRSITLNKLIDDWRYFVAEVERGYSWDTYEYDNDLVWRDLLQAVLDLDLPTLTDQLNKLLLPWDERFRAATYEQPMLIDDAPASDRWWQRRTPRIKIKD